MCVICARLYDASRAPAILRRSLDLVSGRTMAWTLSCRRAGGNPQPSTDPPTMSVPLDSNPNLALTGAIGVWPRRGGRTSRCWIISAYGTTSTCGPGARLARRGYTPAPSPGCRPCARAKGPFAVPGVTESDAADSALQVPQPCRSRSPGADRRSLGGERKAGSLFAIASSPAAPTGASRAITVESGPAVATTARQCGRDRFARPVWPCARPGGETPGM